MTIATSSKILNDSPLSNSTIITPLKTQLLVKIVNTTFKFETKVKIRTYDGEIDVEKLNHSLKIQSNNTQTIQR